MGKNKRKKEREQLFRLWHESREGPTEKSYLERQLSPSPEEEGLLDANSYDRDGALIISVDDDLDVEDMPTKGGQQSQHKLLLLYSF